MAHDVFISHSRKDKAVADAVCAALENAGIRCWIGPRDVQPGRSFGGEIARAIKKSEAMVLIFSAHSNNSDQVLREVQLATDSHLHIIQFRIEEVLLNDDLSYFLSTPHWLDALTPPLENHLDRLKASIRALLGTPAEQSVTAAASTEAQAAASVAQPFGSAPSSSERRDGPASLSRKQEVSTAGKAPSHPFSHGRILLFAGAIVALLTAAVLGGWWFGVQQPRRKADRQRQLTESKGKDHREKEAEQTRLAGEEKAKADADAEKKRLAAQQRANEEEAKEDSLKAPAAASKEQPYVNSLGMKFVPVPETNVLFSVWETRVKDFQAFMRATGHDAEGGMSSLEEKKGWAQVGRTWRDPGFAQTGEHAVCGVNWDDATAFCEWLTEQERKAGRISPKHSYRLPTDVEWSAAVGLEEEKETTPESKDKKVKGVYPWGTKFPPPTGAGNYAGVEARTGGWKSDWKTIEGYRDEYSRTSPVGSFEANGNGIYDLGGNVWEWCEDWLNEEKKSRVLRGASWSNYFPDGLLSSFRSSNAPESREDIYGFRCVLVKSLR